VLLLPENPDRSARDLCEKLRARFGIRLGVLITDTFGRPWREGQTDVAIGAAGLRVLDDLRGTRDAAGRLLHVTAPAVGDEIAAAADLVKGKANGTPVAVVRGLERYVTDELDAAGAQPLVRGADTDMFSRGTTEAWDEGYRAGLEARSPEAGS
jgi:coenzyme F420-0:L-glutamate ligase/coenzyme F420-1:gamma-L-glutamate ligase